MESLETQLQALYSEREELERTLGVSSSGDIIDLCRKLESGSAGGQGGDVVTSMEDQLRTVYAEREQLHDRFGVSDAQGLSEMLESLEGQLVSLYGEKQTASNDPALAIAPMVAEIRATTAALQELYPQVELTLQGGQGPTHWKICGQK
jgi:hypothetical protein